MMSVNFRHSNMDWLRAMAVLLVIFVHALPHLAANVVVDGLWFTFIYESCVSVAFCCNGLFFMLSGYFVIDKAAKYRGSDLLDFYFKRFIRLFVAAAVIGILFYIESIVKGDIIFDWYFAVDYFLRLFTGGVSSHFWFIYYIAGAYLISPFLGRMLESLSDNELKLYMGVLFVCQAVITFSYYSSYGFTFSAFLSLGLANWLFYYQLGYLVKRLNVSISRSVIVLVFACAVVVSFLQKFFLQDNIYTDNQSVTTVVMVVCLFLLFNNAALKGNVVISWVARHSYSVYLFQSLYVGMIQKFILRGITDNRVVLVLWLLGVVLAVIVSLVSAFLFDVLIINPVNSRLLALSADSNGSRVDFKCVLLIGVAGLVLLLEVVMAIAGV